MIPDNNESALHLFMQGNGLIYSENFSTKSGLSLNEKQIKKKKAY